MSCKPLPHPYLHLLPILERPVNNTIESFRPEVDKALFEVLIQGVEWDDIHWNIDIVNEKHGKYQLRVIAERKHEAKEEV